MHDGITRMNYIIKYRFLCKLLCWEKNTWSNSHLDTDYYLNIVDNIIPNNKNKYSSDEHCIVRKRFLVKNATLVNLKVLIDIWF